MSASKVVVVAVGFLVACLAGVGAATADPGEWTVRLSGAEMATTGDGDDTGHGLGTGVEYRFSSRLGVELAAASAELESKPDVVIITFGDPLIVPIELETSVRLTPVMARLNVHLTPGRRADLYVAPVLGWVQVSDDVLRVRSLGRQTESPLDVDDELAWGAAAGLDVPLGGSGSLLSVSATWLRLSLDSVVFGEDATTDLDPLTLTAGYGFRF